MTKIEELKRRVFDLERQMIDVERFYLAFRISQCPKCKACVKVSSWEPPIVMGSIVPIDEGLCEKHEKERDEFNRKYASD